MRYSDVDLQVIVVGFTTERSGKPSMSWALVKFETCARDLLGMLFLSKGATSENGATHPVLGTE